MATSICARGKCAGFRDDEGPSASDTEKQVCKELDRSQEIVRRLEKTVEDLHPERAGAGLSPKYENQPVQLCDDAIGAKTRDVLLT